MMKKLFLISLVIMMVSPAAAEKIGGVNLPDTLAAGKSNLILNGAGLRKKLFIKVYAAGLYLTQKNNDPQKIIEADEAMGIRMHFIYDGVSAEKLIKAWNEGFGNATKGNVAPIKNEIDKFNACFKDEAKEGDIYDIIYVPGQGTAVSVKGKLIETIKGHVFKKALFAIWLGEKPADSGLKKGMIGKGK